MIAMPVKETAAIGLTVIGLAIGANQMLEPTSPREVREQHQQQQVQDLGDANEKQNDKLRDDLNNSIDAENRQKAQPGEYRPDERPKPKIKLRLP